MDSRLYQAEYLGIPLKHNDGHALNPQPNFLIIEQIRPMNKTFLLNPLK